MTDLPPVQADILDLVKCKCKMETRQPYSSVCSCVKHGLPCLTACKHCCGESCENADTTRVVEDEMDIENEVVDAFTEKDIVPDEYLDFDMPWLDEEVID